MSVIKDYRIKKKLSVIGLAERMKVTRRTIYNWEEGIEPNIPQIIRLGKVLGISPTTIFKDYAKRYIK